MSVNNKKLNRSDVRTGIWRFVTSFSILSAVSFAAVYFFFKSYDNQRSGIEQEKKAYYELLEANNIIKIQMDSIYADMSLLGVNKVTNDMFLNQSIMRRIQETKKIIGKDSADNFKHYAVLFKKMDDMLLLKSQIITVGTEEQVILRNLQNCQTKDGQIIGELQKDPSRVFTGRRRFNR